MSVIYVRPIYLRHIVALLHHLLHYLSLVVRISQNMNTGCVESIEFMKELVLFKLPCSITQLLHHLTTYLAGGRQVDMYDFCKED